MPEFNERNPLLPQFWDARFDQGFTPWDRGGAPNALCQFVAQQSRPLATLIPGCGQGHEVRLLREHQWPVVAIDFSESAVALAKQTLGKDADAIVQADFFSYTPPWPVDLIYERAFLCALPPDMRRPIVERWASLLPKGGLVAAYFFLGPTRSGPPFAIPEQELQDLLSPYFERIEDSQVDDSIPVFAGQERWQIWRKHLDFAR